MDAACVRTRVEVRLKALLHGVMALEQLLADQVVATNQDGEPARAWVPDDQRDAWRQAADEMMSTSTYLAELARHARSCL